MRDKINYEIIESKELTPADVEAGVISDQTIRVIVKGSKIDHPVRLVIVKATPHTSRGRRRGRNFSSTGPGSDGSIRLITDMKL